MPHARAAASYATLIREMLVTEKEGRLGLFSGVPSWWFESEQSIRLEHAPTHFGKLDPHTESSIQQTDIGWHGTLLVTLSGAEPPKGFRWRLPEIAVTVDGPVGRRVDSRWLLVPPGGGTARLSFSID